MHQGLILLVDLMNIERSAVVVAKKGNLPENYDYDHGAGATLGNLHRYEKFWLQTRKRAL